MDGLSNEKKLTRVEKNLRKIVGEIDALEAREKILNSKLHVIRKKLDELSPPKDLTKGELVAHLERHYRNYSQSFIIPDFRFRWTITSERAQRLPVYFVVWSTCHALIDRPIETTCHFYTHHINMYNPKYRDANELRRLFERFIGTAAPWSIRLLVPDGPTGSIRLVYCEASQWAGMYDSALTDLGATEKQSISFSAPSKDH